jgi:hypothetical protein
MLECESDDSAWGHHRVQARKEGHVVHLHNNIRVFVRTSCLIGHMAGHTAEAEP